MQQKHKTIIAIDGPAASGKGTLAKKIAHELGYAHLDTGLLYRAVGFAVLQGGGDPEDETAALEAAQNLKGDFSDPHLKSDDVGQAASKVAAIPSVRAALVQYQRDFVANSDKGAVLDGRDIGTVICPEADIKLFITADVEIRAQRRFDELQSKSLQLAGKAVTYEAVLKDMRERDARDQGRQTAPMMPADDALIIDTGHLNAEEAFQKAIELIRERFA